LQFLLLRGWCGFWGLLLHGTPEIHGYVAESLRAFPDRAKLLEIFLEQGFGVSAGRRFFLGITGVTIVRKGSPPASAGV
jgi:demethylmenaquinone methyltransferase/2-methoxy-6-polyprenyl-1,4-benzoquinol methylase